MTGQRVEGRPAPPVGAALLILTAGGLAGMAAYLRSPHPALAGLLPLALAVAILAAREARFAVTLGADALEFDDGARVAYADVTALATPTDRPAPISVHHAAGVVRIPKRLDVRPAAVLAYLLERVGAGGSREQLPPLDKYLSDQEAKFGRDRVFSYRARPEAHHGSRRPVALCAAAALTGLVWLTAGVTVGREASVWAMAGGLLAVLGVVFALALVAERKARRVPHRAAAGLVVGPAGLALVQGDTRGEMKWGELRRVALGRQAGSFQLQSHAQAAPGLFLYVEGAAVVVMDIYDRPLAAIRERVEAYWGGRGANA